MDYRNVENQKELEAAFAAGDIPVCRGTGYFTVTPAMLAASDNTTVEAFGNTTVRAFGNTTVRAFGNTTVEASKYVAIHKMPGHRTKIKGGVVIEVPLVDDAETFVDYYGLKVTRGNVILYRAVNPETGMSTNGAIYKIGKLTRCPDWNDRPECGGGLHLCARPMQTQTYTRDRGFLACQVAISDIVVISPDKVKVPKCKVLYAVDIDGNRI